MIRNIYVSYAWGGKSEKTVDSIEEKLKKKNIYIIRDKNALSYKGNITKFMDLIGDSEHIVIVISNKYLRSINCMYELLMIYKSGKFEERIYPVVLKDAKIYDVLGRMDYSKHWNEEIKKIEDFSESLPLSKKMDFKEDVEIYSEISTNINYITNIIKSMNTLNPSHHIKSNFEEMAREIVKQDNLLIDQAITPNLQKFVQQGIVQNCIEISLYEWLLKNSDSLIEDVFAIFVEDIDDYKRLGLSSTASIDSFKASIMQHVDWLKEILRTLDTDIPKREHVKNTDLLLRLQPACSKFFLIMLEKTKTKYRGLDDDESNMLQDYINFIIDEL